MKKRVYVFWSLLTAIAVARFIFSSNGDIPTIDQCLNREVVGVGAIVTDPQNKESGQIVVIKTESLRVLATSTETVVRECNAEILVRVKTKLYPKFVYGDFVEFSGKILRPYNFSSNNGKNFDYRGFLAKDDIYFEMKSADLSQVPHTVADLRIHEKSTIKSILRLLKRKFVLHLERVLGEPHAALAAGLVVGEKSALGKDLLDHFRIVGLTHIVVLSGFNITIVADAIRRILSRLPRIWGIFIGGIGIMLFGIMVGGGATVVRSCIMAGVALLANLIRRDYSVIRALILAGIIMIIQNPMILLHDLSFQLSFLATLGLVLFSKPIEDRISFLPERFGLRGIVATTFATQIFVAPYIIYVMGQISIIGVVVNILVLPFVPLTMLAVFLTGAFGFIFEPISQIIAWITHLLLSYELSVVEFFARLPFAAVNIPNFSFRSVVIFYIILASILVFMRKILIR